MPEPQPTAATVEYTTTVLIGSNPGASLAATLNQYASQGWVLETIIERTVVFSRPLAAQRNGGRPTLAR
jgi:hypothetical protein